MSKNVLGFRLSGFLFCISVLPVVDITTIVNAGGSLYRLAVITADARVMGSIRSISCEAEASPKTAHPVWRSLLLGASRCK